MAFDPETIDRLMERRRQIAEDLAYWQVEWDRLVVEPAEAMGVTPVVPDITGLVRAIIAAKYSAVPNAPESTGPDRSAHSTPHAS